MPSSCALPHAHAGIRSIDTTAARNAAGVLAVLTGADLAADGLGDLPTDKSRKRRDGSPAFTTPRPALIRDRVRHVGDPVALVVADTMERAVDAAELVAVDYEALPAVAATADAVRPGAPAVWAQAPDNVAFVWEAGNKDGAARGLAAAAHVVRLDFVVSRVAAAPMEPRGAVGEWDRRTGRYTLHTGIQAPHGLRTLARRSGAQGAAQPPARDHGRGRRKLRDEERCLSRGRPGAVGRETTGTAGQVDVRSARGLRHRRARTRQRLHGRARARRQRQVPGAARGDQPEHRRLPHAAQRGARHEQRRRSGGCLHDAGDPRADHRRVLEHDADGALPRRRPAGGDVRDRARHRRRGARAQDRSDRAATPQPDSVFGDAVQDGARLHLRLR